MQGKYHLLSISVIILIVYLLSYGASRFGIISKQLHSKIWNSALLVSFLVTGILGVFLVIQINYKIDVPVVDQITLFHVDFGISLFFISVFHILLHLKYFINLFDKPKSKKADNKLTVIQDKNRLKETLPEKWKILYSIIALGITSIITQIVFIREFVSAFSGNELLIGIIISIWLVLTGTGAFSTHLATRIKNSKRLLIISQALLGILPFIIVFFLPFFKSLVFPVGMQVNYVQIIVFAMILLLPFCFVSGFMFSHLSSFLSAHYSKQKVYLNYSIESLGSLIGGFLFSFILIFFCDTFQILTILLILNLLSIFFIVFKNYKVVEISGLLGLIIIIVFSVLYINIDKNSKKYLFPNQNISSINQSPYGQLVITENSGQLNFFQNGSYLFSSDSVYTINANIAADEESVHFAMLQHTTPLNVLLISGGISGMIHEILKYPVKSIDYVEIDPTIIAIAKKHNPDISNSKIKIINKDTREYLKKGNKKYDVVFVEVPPPTGTETNRFYTFEFFKMLKRNMSDTSVLKLSLPATVNYFDEYALLGNRMIYNTLFKCFKHVKVLPGEKNYYLASDNPLYTNIVERITEKGIENEYVAYYLDDQILDMRSRQMIQDMQGKSSLNRDLMPMSHLLYIKQQWSIFSGSYWVLAFILLITFIFSFRKFNRVRFAMFTGGFASISAELVIIYLFQMVFGNAYQYTGIVFTVFMSGLVLGPLLPATWQTYSNKRIFMFLLLTAGFLVLLLPCFFKIIIESGAGKFILYLLFFCATFITACLTGYIFKQASMFEKENAAKTAGQIYSADLFGSAFGALTISIFIIPVLGLLWSGLIGFVLCVISTLLIRVK